jgi:hypothetical protein
MPTLGVTNPNRRLIPISFTPLPPFPPGATPALPPVVVPTSPPVRALNATPALKPAPPPPPEPPVEFNAALPFVPFINVLAPFPPAAPTVEPLIGGGILVAAEPPAPPATVAADVLP